MRLPVALKVVSPDILHKSDVGGVLLGLSSEQEVRTGFRTIVDTVAHRAPEATIEGVMIQEMAPRGVEIIIGLLNDPAFGPVVMFGLGGVWTEVLRDVSFRLVPLSREDALAMIREIRGAPILSGYRDSPAVDEDALVSLLLNASRMAQDLGDRLEAVDFNPIVVRGKEHWVVDTRVILREEGDRPRAASCRVGADPSQLERFFEAGSVAVVGASATLGKIGFIVLDGLVNHDYRGKVYPVNPSRSEILGLACYPSIRALPEPPELVVVTIPLAGVEGIIEECSERGVRAVVVISGGGKELGGDSLAVETRIREKARSLGVRVVGCNCIGVFDGRSRLDTFFHTTERLTRPEYGPVSMITQSGTVGCAFLEAMVGTGVSRFVSYGNRIDVDEADLLAFLARDPSTKVIVAYVEGFERGRDFFEAAKETVNHKPVLIYKAGRTDRSGLASLSHTGFLGGAYAVARGAFEQCGVIATDSLEDLIAGAKALSRLPRAAGNRVATISNGAGTVVQAMDLLDEFGLEAATLSDESVTRLTAGYPPFYLIGNPVDVTGSGTASDYDAGVRALVDDPGVDIVMSWFVFQDTPLEETIVEVLAELSRWSPKPIICGAAGGAYTDKMARALEEAGVPVFRTVRAWVMAARAVLPGPDTKHLD